MRMDNTYKYIITSGVNLSHLHDSATCSSLKCAIAVAEMNYVDGRAFNVSRIAAEGSMAENLWNSKKQDKLDKDRKSNAYRASRGYALTEEKQCRYSLFNNEGAVDRRHRLA